MADYCPQMLPKGLWRQADHSLDEVPRQLVYPQHSLVVCGGLPGSGKSHFLSHAAPSGKSFFSVEKVLAEQWPEKYQASLTDISQAFGTVLDFTEKVLNLGCAAIAEATVLQPRAAMGLVHLAQMHGCSAHLIFLDVEPEAAREAQAQRQQPTVPEIMWRSYVSAYYAFKLDLSRKDPQALLGDKWSSITVLDRQGGDRIRGITFV